MACIAKSRDVSQGQNPSSVLRTRYERELCKLRYKLQQKLKLDIQRLYASGTHSDLLLVTSTGQVPVHSAVLQARTPAFYSSLYEIQETVDVPGRIYIPTITADNLIQILRKVYTDEYLGEEESKIVSIINKAISPPGQENTASEVKLKNSKSNSELHSSCTLPSPSQSRTKWTDSDPLSHSYPNHRRRSEPFKSPHDDRPFRFPSGLEVLPPEHIPSLNGKNQGPFIRESPKAKVKRFEDKIMEQYLDSDYNPEGLEMDYSPEVPPLHFSDIEENDMEPDEGDTTKEGYETPNKLIRDLEGNELTTTDFENGNQTITEIDEDKQVKATRPESLDPNETDEQTPRTRSLIRRRTFDLDEMVVRRSDKSANQDGQDKKEELETIISPPALDPDSDEGVVLDSENKMKISPESEGAESTSSVPTVVIQPKQEGTELEPESPRDSLEGTNENSPQDFRKDSLTDENGPSNNNFGDSRLHPESGPKPAARVVPYSREDPSPNYQNSNITGFVQVSHNLPKFQDQDTKGDFISQKQLAQTLSDMVPILSGFCPTIPEKSPENLEVKKKGEPSGTGFFVSLKSPQNQELPEFTLPKNRSESIPIPMRERANSDHLSNASPRTPPPPVYMFIGEQPQQAEFSARPEDSLRRRSSQRLRRSSKSESETCFGSSPRSSSTPCMNNIGRLTTSTLSLQSTCMEDDLEGAFSDTNSICSGVAGGEMDSSSAVPYQSCSRLGADLLKMFVDEIRTDVIVRVGDRDIRAHKCILASRCAYFAAMLHRDWVESRGNIIHLRGFSYPAVHFALCHLYSGATDVPNDVELGELAHLADMLGLDGLSEVVSLNLRAHYCHFFHKPCSSCVCGVFECLGITSNCSNLTDLNNQCLRWLARNMSKTWGTRGFSALSDCQLSSVLQMAKESVTVDTVLESTMTCERLVSSLPHVKWTESALALSSQFLEHCTRLLALKFHNVLASTSFHQLGKGMSWDIAALEDTIMTAADNVTPEGACYSFITLQQLMVTISSSEEYIQSFHDLVARLTKQVERFMVHNAHLIASCSAWDLLSIDLQKRIQDASVIVFEFGKPTAPPPKLSSLTRTSIRGKFSTSMERLTGSSLSLSSQPSSRSGSLRSLGGSKPKLSPSTSCNFTSTGPPPPILEPSPVKNRTFSPLTSPKEEVGNPRQPSPPPPAVPAPIQKRVSVSKRTAASTLSVACRNRPASPANLRSTDGTKPRPRSLHSPLATPSTGSSPTPPQSPRTGYRPKSWHAKENRDAENKPPKRGKTSTPSPKTSTPSPKNSTPPRPRSTIATSQVTTTTPRQARPVSIPNVATNKTSEEPSAVFKARSSDRLTNSAKNSPTTQRSQCSTKASTAKTRNAPTTRMP